MSTKNQSVQTRKFGISVLLLVGLLLPAGSVLAQTPTPPPGSFAKQLPSDGVRSQNPATAENITLLAAPNLLLDPSFEASAGSNLYWEQSSTNFGPFIVCPSTAPGPAGCGNGGGTAGPRTGSAWAWFGGVDFTDPNSVSPEEALMSQNVTFPSCGATLQFYLWIGTALPGSDANDFFLAGIDGNIVFLTNATQIGSYPTYTLVSVDVSSFANGAVHRVDFYSNISGQNVNFNLDDVSLVSGNCAISGNTGVAGVTLSYTDDTPKTATSQANGSYSLPVSGNWSGTVTPSHACFTFSPTNRSYSNVTTNRTGQNYTPTFIPASGCADIDVVVHGSNQGRFGIPADASIRAGFLGVDNGPVKVVSTNTIPILAALRVIWKEPGARTSYSEMMGLPKEQLSSEYWFPWYNNLDTASMDQGFRIANVNTSSNTVEVWVGDTKLDTITLAAGGSIRVSYLVNNGPVRIACTTCTNTGSDKIIAALRVIWKEPGQRFSYSEMMGLPKEHLSSEYWFPWYNNAAPASMDQGFRIANVDAASNTIQVWVGNVKLGADINLGPGASTRVGFAVDNGPIRIVCTTCTNIGSDKIIAALRIIWKEPGYRSSYSEMMGLPIQQLSSEYWFPWYNNATPSMDQGFRIANVDAAANTIQVWVGSTMLDSFSLGSGASTRVGYLVDNGPIRIVCTTCTNTGSDKILTALRIIWKELGFRSSYSEMMGLPTQLLSTEYWFPWYNFATPAIMDQGLRISVP